jgi:asparagine synthase (glutamine-hydrolysing)
MCGIAAILDLDGRPVPRLAAKLALMSRLIAHRGPDGDGFWTSPRADIGLMHRRLAIIDLSPSGAQPMAAPNGTVVTYNGEIYNYLELRDLFEADWQFRSTSDTETILAAYDQAGEECLASLRGMFAFALWDERQRKLFAARDRFGIKPLYWVVVDRVLYLASEVKALVPFLPEIATDADALAEYLTFQYTLGERTLFRHVHSLPPGHMLVVQEGAAKVTRYWDVHYRRDFDHTPRWFERRLAELLDDSVRLHLRADVPVGAYVSGGMDSSLIGILAARTGNGPGPGFHGRFTDHPGYDESGYARIACEAAGTQLMTIDITADDFSRHIREVIWHLDMPVAGPGSFPQFMVSALAARHRKVVLGGQGGDELFGGYARYLLAYFEQCIRAAIDGTYRNGHFVVTIESILPNLGLLREYKPMMKEFWRQGLFEDLDARYFRLVDRSTDMNGEVDWSSLDRAAVAERFRAVFNNTGNVRKDAYFDRMTHFDFKCLLPALLQVEDRMSMAHGLESRVPLLDHPLVEFLATVPADVKFAGGSMKHLLKQTYRDVLPADIRDRRDKMGFPVPLREWVEGPLAQFVAEVFAEAAARRRDHFNPAAIVANAGKAGKFSRKLWGLLSLELWHQQFHDRAAEFRAMVQH